MWMSQCCTYGIISIDGSAILLKLIYNRLIYIYLIVFCAKFKQLISVDGIMASLNDNHTIIMYRAMVEAFEKYETLFNELNPIDLNLIHNQQLTCLATIENMIWDENDYFESLYNLHEDLTNQIKNTQNLRNQIQINDLTITRIDNGSFGTTIEKLTGNEGTSKKDNTNNSSSNQLVDVIDNTLILPNANGLMDIYGLKREKKILREAVIYPILYPQLFTGNRKKWNTALLYGPTGTGKTQLAHCLAAEINANFYNVSSADLLSSFIGESEKLIKLLFENCQKNTKNSIIFIDEIDALCRVRKSSEKEYERRIKNELLNQLSSLEKQKNNKIFLLGCTNCPWDLDTAFIRRFQKRIYIPLPDREARQEMFQNLSNTILEKVLDMTEGWSGSDIHDLIKCAEYQPLKDLESATHWIITSDNKYMPAPPNKYNIEKNIKKIPSEAITVRQIEAKDYLTAFNEVTKTVTNENIAKFEQFNESFGSIKMKK